MNSQAPEKHLAPDDPTALPAEAVPECKRVLALLTAAPAWDPELCAVLEEHFGPIDFRGPFLPFNGDTYYVSEMGGPLWRGWLSFRGLANPRDLPAWKHRTRVLEARWSENGKRTRNLDVGYMDSDKLVLASFKRGPFKLYLDAGVWGDAILGYSRGAFVPAPRAFPDFRDGRYDQSLRTIREKLKAAMRAGGRADPGAEKESEGCR